MADLNRLRALAIVQTVERTRKIEGMVGREIVKLPISLQYLADRGVPENLTLPFDSSELRALVQEFAQLRVD